MDFCILHLCLVPMKVRMVALELLELESLTVVNNHVLLVIKHTCSGRAASALNCRDVSWLCFSLWD